MKNVSMDVSCYGCGTCAIACPTNAIEISLNAEGFYHPNILDDKCIGCGLCVSVCSFLNEGIIQDSPLIKSYAAWSLTPDVRKKSSSGGVSHEIFSYFIKQGYNVCTVRYNVKQHKAEHYIAESMEQLEDSYGSKYIQSYTIDGLSDIDFNKKHVVIGTPCMIDSFKRFVIKKKAQANFVYVDFFCHGVPSYFLWQKYIRRVEMSCGDISTVSFRYKDSGWYDSYKMFMKGKRKDYLSGLNQGDLFYKLFLGDYCLGKQCYHNCKFKLRNSAADIRVGDLWGRSFNKNCDGVSAVLALTQCGYEVLQKVHNIHLQEEPFEIVTEGQMAMSPEEPKVRQYILMALISIERNFIIEKGLMFLSTMCHKIRKIITQPHIVIKNRFIK